MSTLWHGRFATSPAEDLVAFTESRSFDKGLYRWDIKCSVAHVEGLRDAQLLTALETQAILDALGQVLEELDEDRFVFVDSDEDIHTAIERRVTELSGDIGAKLHTARSRNDQIATTMRLYCRDIVLVLSENLLGLQQTLLQKARNAGDAYLPGYTHLQRAQPVLLAHHLAAHVWSLRRDFDRLCEARSRLNISPLGAGAIGGTSLGIDPIASAKRLGFAAAFENSMDVVSDRDFVADLLYATTTTAIHLSRLGEEVIIWSSAEFGFMQLDDAFATGSSMLPQKKNPDIAELVRGKSGRLIGNLTGFLATMKALPLSYNRDLQEDKEPLFDSVRQLTLGLRAMRGLMETAVFDLEAMASSADPPEVSAIDLADWLVENGMAFRHAHSVVGSCVRTALAENRSLIDVVGKHEDLGPEAAQRLVPGASIGNRRSRGGSGTLAVAEQLQRLEQCLDAQSAIIDSWRD